MLHLVLPLKTRDCERSQPSLIYRWARVLYTLRAAQRDGGRGSIVEHSTIKDTSTHLPSRPTPYELHGSWCPHAYSRTLKYTRLFYPSCSEIRKTEQWAVYSKTSSGCPEVVKMSVEVLTTIGQGQQECMVTLASRDQTGGRSRKRAKRIPLVVRRSSRAYWLEAVDQVRSRRRGR